MKSIRENNDDTTATENLFEFLFRLPRTRIRHWNLNYEYVVASHKYFEFVERR